MTYAEIYGISPEALRNRAQTILALPQIVEWAGTCLAWLAAQDPLLELEHDTKRPPDMRWMLYCGKAVAYGPDIMTCVLRGVVVVKELQ